MGSVIIIPPQNECFREGILESLCPSVCVQNTFTSFCNNAGGGIKSHLVTALVLFINPFPNKPLVLCVCSTSLLKNTVEKVFLCVGSASLLKILLEKGENARHKRCLLFLQCFQPFWKTLSHFLKT